MKNFFINLLDTFVGHFGFDGMNDFISSILHIKLMLFTIPMSFAVFAFLSKYLGMTYVMVAAFLVLAIMELVTGIWGSLATKKKIKSKKLGRFGLKILVWFALIFVAHSFAQSYEHLKGVQNYIVYQIFNWFHGVLMIYVSFEYIISILENLAKITGKTNNRLIRFITNKMDKVLGWEDEDEETPKESTNADPVEGENDSDVNEVVESNE